MVNGIRDAQRPSRADPHARWIIEFARLFAEMSDLREILSRAIEDLHPPIRRIGDVNMALLICGHSLRAVELGDGGGG